MITHKVLVILQGKCDIFILYVTEGHNLARIIRYLELLAVQGCLMILSVITCWPCINLKCHLLQRNQDQGHWRPSLDKLSTAQTFFPSIVKTLKRINCFLSANMLPNAYKRNALLSNINIIFLEGYNFEGIGFGEKPVQNLHSFSWEDFRFKMGLGKKAKYIVY